MNHLKKWSILSAILIATGIALVAILALGPGATRVAGEPDYQGPNRPYSQGDVAQFSLPAQAFTRDGNCSDGSYCATASSGQTQEYDDFRFAVPTYATIKGVEVQIGGEAGAAADSVKIRLLDGDGAPQNDQKIASLPTSPTYNEPTVGGSTDRWGWGTSLTPTVVNDADFGVEVKNDGTSNAFKLDYVTVKVYLLDTDGDGVLDGLDNCPTVENGPAKAGTPGVGDQDNTDWDLGHSTPSAKYNATPIGDANGDACDSDDDDDLWSDTDEQSLPLPTNPFDNCYGSPGTGGDTWPPDFAANKTVDTGDAGMFSAAGNFGNTDTWVRKRLDLDHNGTVNITDYFVFILYIDDTCQ